MIYERVYTQRIDAIERSTGLYGRNDRHSCDMVAVFACSDDSSRLTTNPRKPDMTCGFIPKVTAIVPVFRPPAARLNKCLKCLLPQVDEIVVSVDLDGALPAGLIVNDKICFTLRLNGQNSYGQNANNAATKAGGDFLWFVNDDFYAEPNCAKELLDAMTLGVGVVGHLILYPDGRVCHAGKYRKPGMREWKHYLNTWHKAVVEMEVVTGTSCLVRRQAHEAIGGFDPDFQFYSEDDDYCLRMRQAGWKVMYTPFCSGIHEEAQSTTSTGRRKEWENRGHELMNRKWGWWFDKNKNTIPGTFE